MDQTEFDVRYRALAHAVQSAVAMEMGARGIDVATRQGRELKQLRTGLNLVMADLGSLSRLLVARGLLTQAEVCAAFIEGLEKEVESFEKTFGVKFG